MPKEYNDDYLSQIEDSAKGMVGTIVRIGQQSRKAEVARLSTEFANLLKQGRVNIGLDLNTADLDQIAFTQGASAGKVYLGLRFHPDLPFNDLSRFVEEETSELKPVFIGIMESFIERYSQIKIQEN